MALLQVPTFVICNYVSQMWSLAREPFSRFDLVARIDLRDLSDCKVISPSSIAKRILERSKNNVNIEQLIEFENRIYDETFQVLWIFDSLDEAKQVNGGSNDFYEFISGGMFSTSWINDLIVTSKPGHWKKAIDVHCVKLMPFDSLLLWTTKKDETI